MANPTAPNNTGGDRAASRPGGMGRSGMPINAPNTADPGSRTGNPAGYGREPSMVGRSPMIPTGTKGTADNRGDVATGTPRTVDSDS